MTIFLDTETTGLDVNDKICSIALIIHDNLEIKEIYNLVNEGKKISPLASSINHITNEMIKDKPNLVDTKAYKFLQVHNSISTTIIGHNVKFDLEKLNNSGFKFLGDVIDTLRVTKHLIPECEKFSLQYLRYELKLYKNEKENIVAHNALGDSLVVKELYNYLLQTTSMANMLDLSTKNVLMQKFEFGKYSGRYIEDISMCDRGYLEWMLANIVDLDEDLRYSITYYL